MLILPHRSCYLSFLREDDYVQQQRVAMKLSKMAGAGAGPQYLWWAVTSLLLQARAAAAGAPGSLNAGALRAQPVCEAE